MRPVGAGGLLEAEKSTGLLVDPPLALKGVSEVLHILLDDATWEELGAEWLFHLRIQTRQWHEWQSQIQEKCDPPVTSPQ